MICSPYAVLCAAIAIALPAGADTVTFLWHNGVVATQPYNASQFVPGSGKSINDGGVVAGSVQDPATMVRTAATWDGSNTISLTPVAGFRESVAASINNQGMLVGGSLNAGSIEPTAWVNGSTVDLGMLPGIIGPYGVVGGLANTLNGSGQIVGFQYAGSGVIPILWQSGLPTQLDRLRDGDSAEPTDINESGNIVGYSGGQPVTWQNGVISALPGCSSGAAYAVNDVGQAVGYCGSDAVLWDTDGMKIVGPDIALGIDNGGTIVGRTSDNPLASQTYVWTASHGMQVLPGFVWSQPLAISPNSGFIIGYGELAPEPSAMGLAIAGGMILILIGSRRRRA